MLTALTWGLLCRCSNAGPILNTNETLNASEDLSDWTNSPAFEQVINPTNYFQLSFAAITNRENEVTYSFIAPVSDLFTGNSSSNYGISSFDTGWSGGLGGEEKDLLADLEMVDWIGSYVKRTSSGQPDYRLDDQMLYVPEPAEIFLLFAGIAGLASAWRRTRRLSCRP